MLGANANIGSLAQECKCQSLPTYQTPRICKSSDNKLIIKVHRKTSVKNEKCAFKT